MFPSSNPPPRGVFWTAAPFILAEIRPQLHLKVDSIALIGELQSFLAVCCDLNGPVDPQISRACR